MWVRRGLLATAAMTAMAAATAAPPSWRAADELAHWPKDRVELRGGKQCEGWIESEDAGWVRLIAVEHPPGRRPYAVIRLLPRAEIVRIDRTDPSLRAAVIQRIEGLRHRAQIEAARLETIELTLDSDREPPRYVYRGDWFTLECATSEPMARRLAAALEQAFTAFQHVLPPRTEPTTRLSILVFGDWRQYDDQLRRLGVRIANPACFVPSANQVLAGTPFGRLEAEAAKVEAANAERQQEIDALRRDVPRVLAALNDRLKADGMPDDERRQAVNHRRMKLQREIDAQQQALAAARRENQVRIDQEVAAAVRRLNHEAFHAYLENYVFPADAADVPLWLNEGLAQAFEAAVGDGFVLRLDAPNPAAVVLLAAEAREDRLLPLGELLAAGPKEFLAGPETQRFYAYAWALVHYLAFERECLDPEALARYVARPAEPNATGTIRERFERLVGADWDDIERDWRRYVRSLR